jgi:hypothetical protein
MPEPSGAGGGVQGWSFAEDRPADEPNKTLIIYVDPSPSGRDELDIAANDDNQIAESVLGAREATVASFAWRGAEEAALTTTVIDYMLEEGDSTLIPFYFETLYLDLKGGARVLVRASGPVGGPDEADINTILSTVVIK